MRLRPVCQKCGAEHYNFQSCVEGKRKYGPVEVVYRNDDDGFRPFGDRLESYERQGSNLVLKTKKVWDKPDEAA